MDDAPAPQPLLTTPPEPIQAGDSVTRRGPRGLLSFIACFLPGIVLGAALISVGNQPVTSLPLATLLLLLLLSLWLSTRVHELGRALPAGLMGWREWLQPPRAATGESP